MRTHLRMVAVVAIGLVAYAVLLHAFHLLNQASDRGWYGGITLILVLLLLVPIVVRGIWRML